MENVSEIPAVLLMGPALVLKELPPETYVLVRAELWRLCETVPWLKSFLIDPETLQYTREGRRYVLYGEHPESEILFYVSATLTAPGPRIHWQLFTDPLERAFEKPATTTRGLRELVTNYVLYPGPYDNDSSVLAVLHSHLPPANVLRGLHAIHLRVPLFNRLYVKAPRCWALACEYADMRWCLNVELLSDEAIQAAVEAAANGDYDAMEISELREEKSCPIWTLLSLSSFGPDIELIKYQGSSSDRISTHLIMLRRTFQQRRKHPDPNNPDDDCENYVSGEDDEFEDAEGDIDMEHPRPRLQRTMAPPLPELPLAMVMQHEMRDVHDSADGDADGSAESDIEMEDAMDADNNCSYFY